MAHKHSVYDTDLHFSIDALTRGISNLAKDKTTIIQHDHNSERFTFEVPRYVDGHDMSLCNVVQVHYLNIEAAHKDNKFAGIYEVEDLQISPDGDDVVILSWLISGNATQYVGSLNFVVRFCCVADDGTVEYAWNTAVFSGVSVSTGICNSDFIVEEYADVLEQWRNELEKLYGSAAKVVYNETTGELKIYDPEAAEIVMEELDVDSKNLCSLGTVTFVRTSGYMEIGSTLESGKTYTLSAEVTSDDTDSATGMCAVYIATANNKMTNDRYTIKRGKRASVTFTCPTDMVISKVVFYAAGTTSTSDGDTATFADIQIEEGSTATEYIPYGVSTTHNLVDRVAREKIEVLSTQFIDVVEKTKWLAVGDSITRGVYSYKNGDSSASAVGDGWVRKLAKSLGYDIVVMASRGMGYTAAVTGQDPEDSSLPRISLDTLLTRIEALEEDFNLITVAFGINDYATISQASIDTILAGLDDAIQRLMAKFPGARLVVITPFNSCRAGDASTNYAYGYTYGGRSLKDIADAIKEKCESYGVECIYASNGFLINNFNIETLLPDNTHPSDYGHTLIAKNMAHYLLF